MSPSPATRRAVTGKPDSDEKAAETALANRLGGEVIATQDIPNFDSAELIGIESWDDIAGVVEAHGIDVVFADKVLGDGFSVLSTDEKATLIGRPMMFLEWRFNNGTQGEFVSIRAIVKTGDQPTDIRKVIINDGSTGVKEDLKKFTQQTGKQAGLLIRRGFRVSEYMYEDANGVQRPAKTFYIDTSA